MNTKFHVFEVSGLKAIALYDYDQKIESLLYQFKGCYDIELAPVFFERYYRELHIIFSEYIIIPIPSYYIDDEKRGFNHVEEMYKSFELPILKLLSKTEQIKQANTSKSGREEISKYLKLNSDKQLTDKKVLIVDDVYTTGSTIKAAIKLIKKLNPKDIKILVMSKTLFKEKPNTK